jgi:hypothetical protein
MKTVRIVKTGGVERLSDQAAELLVSKNAATYLPKSAYKTKDLGERALKIHQQAKQEARQV